MSQAPTPYTRQNNFVTDAGNPNYTIGLAATDLDAEYEAIKTSVNETISRLNELQRDDGRLKEGTVSSTALGSDVATLLGIEGSSIRGAWQASGTSYALRDLVSEGTATYLCIIPHTSSELISDDVNLGRWLVLQAPAPTTLTIPANSITSAELAAGSVTSSELGSSSVTTEKIASGAIVAGHLSAGAVTASALASSSVGATAIQNLAVTAAKMENIAGLSTGTFGGSASVPVVTVDQKGRVSAISTTPVQISSSALQPIAGLTAGEYGSENLIPVVTVGANGLVQSISTVAPAEADAQRISSAWCEIVGNIAAVTATTFSKQSDTEVLVSKAAHGVLDGDFVTFDGIAAPDDYLNGTWTVSSVTTNTFVFTISGATVPDTALTVKAFNPSRIVNSYNVSKAGRLAKGLYKFYFTSPLASANYIAMANNLSSTANNDPGGASTTYDYQTDSVSVSCTGYSATQTSMERVRVIVFGQ